MRIHLLCLLFLTGCAAGGVRQEDAPIKTEASTTPVERPTSFRVQNYDVDYAGLQRFLKLEAGKTQLGWRGRAFQSCDVGYGLPRHEFCQPLYFNVLNFRLQCRDSEGTTSTVQSNWNVQPIANEDLKWEIAGMSGVSTTDDEGFGQILVITKKNGRGERLRLSNQRDFLYMRVGDVTRVVTPASWCQ